MHTVGCPDISKARNCVKVMGLIVGFLGNSYFESIHRWTIQAIRAWVLPEEVLTADMLYTCVGLELGMLLTNNERIRDYWSDKYFLGQEEFRAGNEGDDFKNIMNSLILYQHYSQDVSMQDPLWCSRLMLDHFRQNAATVAKC